nr:FKBP-type peptidyl-prolyl cis-trans isomerase [Iamia sp. SCSIO 61187]
MSPHRSPRAPRRLAAAGALALTLVLVAGACSSEEEGNVVADVFEDDSLPTQPAAPESAAGKECVEPVEPTEFEGKPEVEMPVGEVPTELETTDITPGDGAEAVEGKLLRLNYVGVACSTGEEFDTSWKEGGEPIELTLGAGEVIPGWDQGLVGMKVGGTRRLVIPAELGYGATGSGPDIAPDEALVFVVELLEVSDPPPESETTVPEGEAPADPDATTTTAAEGETTTTAAAEGETTTTAAEG